MTNVLGSPVPPHEQGNAPASSESLGGNAGKIISIVTSGLPKSPDSGPGAARFHASDLPNQHTLPEQGPYHEITASVAQLPGDEFPRLTGLSMMWGNRDATPDDDGVTRLRTTLDLRPDLSGNLRRTTKEEVIEPGATESKVIEHVDQLDATNVGDVAAMVEEHGVRPFQQPPAPAP